jgi:putative transposase
MHSVIVCQALARLHSQLLAYCLMGNHFHLELHTRQAKLPRLIRNLNGIYTQSFNRRHGLSGGLFQGRFKAIFVDVDARLMAVCSDVECMPVAAGLVLALVSATVFFSAADCLALLVGGTVLRIALKL